MTVMSLTGPGVDDEFVTDDDDAAAPIRPTPLAASPFEALQAAMKAPLPEEHFAITHVKRRNIEVRLRGNVELDELNEWRKGAQDRTFPGGYNLLRYACILLANTCVDIVIDGNSTEMTLADPRISQMYPQAADEVEAVRWFFDKEDLWLSGRVLPALTAAWSGGDQDDDVVRPTTVD